MPRIAKPSDVAQVEVSSPATAPEKGRFTLSRSIGLGALLAVMAAAFLIPGLTRGTKAVGTVEGLKGRVTAFWEARLKKDHQAIYDLYEPRLHEAASLAEFLRSRGLIDYFVYSVEDVRVDGDKGSSRVKYTWKPNHPAFASMKPKEDAMEDKWIFVDGNWRKLYEGFSNDQNPLPPGADPSSVRQVQKSDVAPAPAPQQN